MNLKQLLHVCTGFFIIYNIINIIIASLLTQKPYASVQNHNFMKITSMPILGSELIKKPFTTSLVKTV